MTDHETNETPTEAEARLKVRMLPTYEQIDGRLDAYATAVRAAERERCVKVVSDQRLSFPSGQYTSIELTYNEAIDDACKALRMLTEDTTR